jgi:hypothetical protein
MDSDTFINLIDTKNSIEFEKLNIKRICEELRNEIYTFLISRKDEEDFFDITKYIKNKQKDCLEFIYDELEKAGWKYKLSYGDTGLFIFKENVPRNCW